MAAGAQHLNRGVTDSEPVLCDLLERIYDTGKVETEHGETRVAEPVGVPRAHALRLADLVREERLERTLETGMAYGLSTLAIAGVHAARGAGRHIAIDPTASTYYEGIGPANLRRAGVSDRVLVLEEPSQSALPRLFAEGVRIDFGFIDGMHVFDYALVDFFYVDWMLATGGFVALHDAWMPAITDLVDFVLANRDYERRGTPDGGLVILRKRSADSRPWNHYRPFARPRSPARPPEEVGPALSARLRAGAREAADLAGGFLTHDLVLAGSPVRMSFAGDALEPVILPAFAHAQVGEQASAERLEILLWDSASSGAPEPAVPWSLGDVRARGDVRGFEGQDVAVFSEPASGAMTVFDRTRGEIVYWVADGVCVQWHERGAPLRSALHHWAASLGRHFVHAGAVGNGRAGVLLAGPTGSGKSTAALACLAAGFEYAGDDYVILTDGDEVRAHCIYSTAKLDAGALERLPALEDAVTDYRRERETKAVLDLAAHRPDRVVGSIGIDAVVLPTIAARAGATVVRRASGADAMRALAPTTLLQLPGAAHARMKAIARLVRSVPVFALEIGADIADVPEAIERICVEAAGAVGSAEREG
jgi:predicted O-methyltransferase YrrM